LVNCQHGKGGGEKNLCFFFLPSAITFKTGIPLCDDHLMSVELEGSFLKGCYDFKNIFAEKFSKKKLAFLTQNKAKLCKILIITLVFEKNANFFSQKIVENRRKL
jgi:hypothetical protein